MSEIAKCPLCGKGMSIYVYRQRLVVSCDSEDCSFRCNNDDLHRIAAAMELAKRHKELDNYKGVNPNIVMDLVHDITVAEHYVLEVFK